MDLATLIGLLGTIGLIITAMLMAGNLAMFADAPSFVIVVGGTVFAVMIKFGLSHYLSALKVAGKSFMFKSTDPIDLIAEIVELADAARKGGLLSLEGRDVSHSFLQKGIQLLVDGHDPEVVKTLMSKDKALAVERHEMGAKIFTGMAETAPAMGMIGTLVGLVAMLSNMDDPKSIGPAMAVALLTTLYGAVMANGMFGPMADKLKLRAAEEALTKRLIIDALLAIQSGQNPRVIDSMLRTYLPEGKREAADAG